MADSFRIVKGSTSDIRAFELAVDGVMKEGWKLVGSPLLLPVPHGSTISPIIQAMESRGAAKRDRSS